MRTPALGIRANWQQFALLVFVNAFVGAMVGIERAILPPLAEQEFGVASRTAILSFVASFGLAKALANFAAGRLADGTGRRPLLLAGWLIGLPVPVVIILAPSWEWVVAANLLLGVNQGLCWSMTVVMKVDLAGPVRRGLALGINEFAGYVAVGLLAFVATTIASAGGLRPTPFLLGELIALGGLLLSLFARETHAHARSEAPSAPPTRAEHVFARTTFTNPALSSATQAGLVNNLNDGLAWGLLPLYFLSSGLDLGRVGVLAAVYPTVWGLAQLATGALSDIVGRRWLVVGGMTLQGLALASLVPLSGFAAWLAAMALLGLGTALVYPTLLAVVSDVAHPTWRASSIGVYRLWRDAGYVAGAFIAGTLADSFGAAWAIEAVAGLTLCSGLVALLRLPETRAARSRPREHSLASSR